MKKFELTNETTIYLGKKLYRVRYLKDFANVRAGDLGGFIANEKNLSHRGNARVTGNAWVTDDARVTGNAWVTGDARVTGNAWVTDDARVTGNACVTDDACVTGNAWVAGNACVTGDARVTGNAWVTDDACVTGDARVTGNAWVTDDACVTGDARVTGDAWVTDDARVGKCGDLITFYAGQYPATFTRSNSMVRIGCEHRHVDEWLEFTKEQASELEFDVSFYDVYMAFIVLCKEQTK